MLTSIAVMTWRSLRTMVTRRFATAAAGIGACALVAAAAYAQAPESVNVDIAGCADVETREQQIACYLVRVEEAVAARRAEAAAGGEPGPGGTSSTPPRNVQAESREPGPPTQRPAQQPQRSAPAAITLSEGPDEAESVIVARIASFREMEPDAYLITLDNGQVWRQSSPKDYFLREGAEVRLNPTRWGESYRLTDPDVGNFIQVERVH